jgi:hypothetical protein
LDRLGLGLRRVIGGLANLWLIGRRPARRPLRAEKAPLFRRKRRPASMRRDRLR